MSVGGDSAHLATRAAGRSRSPCVPGRRSGAAGRARRCAALLGRRFAAMAGLPV